MVFEKVSLIYMKMLGLLVKTLATDEKYLVLDRDNLTIPIQMQLSQKEKSFSPIFASFLGVQLKFKRYEQKDDTLMFCVSEITDQENVVRSMRKKFHFRRPFDKQHGKRAQALLKSESHYPYQIH